MKSNLKQNFGGKNNFIQCHVERGTTFHLKPLHFKVLSYNTCSFGDQSVDVGVAVGVAKLDQPRPQRKDHGVYLSKHGTDPERAEMILTKQVIMN